MRCILSEVVVPVGEGALSLMSHLTEIRALATRGFGKTVRRFQLDSRSGGAQGHFIGFLLADHSTSNAWITTSW